MIEITLGDFSEFAGYDLKNELRNPNEAKRLIKRATNLVYRELRHYKPHTNNVALKTAILHQIEYMLTHGDIDIYNPDNIPLLAPNAYNILRENGLANLP